MMQFVPTKHIFVERSDVVATDTDGKEIDRESFDTFGGACDACKALYDQYNADEEVRIEGSWTRFTLFELTPAETTPAETSGAPDKPE